MLSILQHVFHIDDVAYGCSVKLIGAHIHDSMCVGEYWILRLFHASVQGFFDYFWLLS